MLNGKPSRVSKRAAILACQVAVRFYSRVIATSVISVLFTSQMLEEEEEFYKLRPANKTDHLCQSWQ